MNRLLAGVIAGTILVLAGCGGAGRSKPRSTSPGERAGVTQAGSTTSGARNRLKKQVGAPKPGTKRSIPSGQTFQQARKACATSGVDQIAHTFKIGSRDARAVARGYSQKVYDPARRAEAFRGCLAGFIK